MDTPIVLSCPKPEAASKILNVVQPFHPYTWIRHTKLIPYKALPFTLMFFYILQLCVGNSSVRNESATNQLGQFEITLEKKSYETNDKYFVL